MFSCSSTDSKYTCACDRPYVYVPYGLKVRVAPAASRQAQRERRGLRGAQTSYEEPRTLVSRSDEQPT